jgi:hypothetical protein
MGALGTFYEETQMNPIILIGCFTPLVLIFIIMKLAVWISADMEIAQTIDEALFRYYSEQGKPVPRWKLKKDPDWWSKYLDSLGIDPKNP